MYDIFYVSKTTGLEEEWKKIRNRFPTAQRIDNVQNYDQVRSKAFTKLFWVIWDDLTLLDSFDLAGYKASVWDNNYVHVFRNGKHYDGICLFPKTSTVTQKEFTHRFFTEKKEVDIQASKPKPYDKFTIASYDEYLMALEKSTTDMFWAIWPEIDLVEESILDTYYPHYNCYDRNENHVFKHLLKNEEVYNGGIVLLSKNKKISKKEVDHRFLIEKKEHNTLVSKTKPYDIIFISYNEPNADNNYRNLLKRFPRAKRIDGIKGIHQAHIRAAEISDTDMFWVVDGDAVISNKFNFDYELSTYEKDTVYVWRSQNPVNHLVYGYGGVKLLPKRLTLKMNLDSSDVTTAISKKFKAVKEVSNITKFNTDSFNAWKGAFRECAKLSSKIIRGQLDAETEERLSIWCSVGKDKSFGEFVIAGAIAGKKYGEENSHDLEKLNKINDFEWLYTQFRLITN